MNLLLLGAEWDVSDPTLDDSELLVTAKHGVVASDVDVCSQIGVDTLKKGGNAVDAAIATAACIGTVNMFASGIGGGGFMVVRMANGTSKSFNFREAAPKNATRDMYSKDANLAQVGGLAVAVPGELHGFSSAHQLFGALPWREIWAPSIKLNTDGFIVTPTLERLIAKEEKFFRNNTADWSFVFNPQTGKILTAGEIMKRPAYSKTLHKISNPKNGDNYAGVKDFYNGTLAQRFSEVIQAHGGMMTPEDFSAYSTVVSEPVNTSFLGNQVLTCPPPCSGAVLLEGLNIAELLPMTDPSDAVSHHYIIETMKWLSAGRTELGDPFDSIVQANSPRIQQLITKEYAASVARNISSDKTYNYTHYNPAYEPNSPAGTSHLSVIDQHGNAVGLTTTVNLYWGAKVHDPETGVVMNSEMDDFSIPGKSNAYNLKPSIYNYIQPFKRPLSSTAPTIVVNEHGEAIMVVGASGGSRIVTAVFQGLIKKLVWGYGLLETVKSPRLHHQLIPEVVSAEDGVPESVVRGLRERGHTVNQNAKGEAAGGSVMQGAWREVERENGEERKGELQGVADWWRKGGRARGY
ncbi:gamma-glutamyltranspeptidase [Pyronema domesticum]|nr:gamma-glutamyltranspeptidase [Pyronema domesticum]